MHRSIDMKSRVQSQDTESDAGVPRVRQVIVAVGRPAVARAFIPEAAP